MSPSHPLTVITRVPLPAYLAPEAVLGALHAHEPLIGANPYSTRHERRPIPAAEVGEDPHFDRAGDQLQGYLVYDRVPIIPGAGSWASMLVLIPCIFQNFERGVRCRAEAQGGVTVRSSYEVRRRGEVEGGTVAPNDSGEGDCELIEIANIECSSLVKPFVRSRFSSAHQEILQRVVDKVAQASGPKPSVTPPWEDALHPARP
ncbi:hypothetical protein B0H63DRAFT_99912 [Podospora didyma]|uniref:DUF7053 domain-containing protein n=1 Tax=Podospora didyma TaxID=330526 RepID=A0AAE0NX97_9PEZI|nr:hypothetical protein B0H63DRAFT_99912 [Podospora didyma]